MKEYRCQAVVLDISSHGESDKIVTLYSTGSGKITAIAKGAHRSRQRFVNKLELFSCLTIMYRLPGRGTLFFLKEAELLDSFIHLRQEYPRYLAAAFCSELTRRFVREQDPDPDIFLLLRHTLAHLDQGKKLLPITTLFLLRLLALCGYQPQLDRCSRCATTVSAPHRYVLSIHNGHLLCDRCRRHQASPGQELSIPLIKFLQNGQYLASTQLHRLHISDHLAAQALTILHAYALNIFQCDISSWKSLQPLFRQAGGPTPHIPPRSGAPDQLQQLLGADPGADIGSFQQ